MMIRAVNTTSSPTLSTLSTPSTSISGSGAAGSPSPTLSFLTNSSFPSSSPSISISSTPTASLHPGLGLARPPPLPRAEMDTSPNPNLPNPNSTRPGVIVGATVGSVIGVFIILFAIFWYKGKGCIDRNRPPSKSPADETYTPSPQPMTGPSGSRVSFATAQTSASRSARSNAPSPPAPTPKPSFSIDLERGNGAHPASPSTLTVHGLGPPQPCALDSEYHGENLNRLSVDAPMPDPDDSQDHGFAPEWTHAQPPSRSPSRQSISSMTSRISKMSKTSRSRLSATLSRPSTSNQNLRQHYTTTTERLRDRPFSTIYDADSVGWDKDVANIADVSDSESYCEDGRRSLDEPTGGRYPHPYDVDVHNIPEVTVHDPSLHSDSSGTPSPCAMVALRADKHKEDNKLTARERMMALYSSSQQNLRLSSEDRERENKYHYTPTHKKRESQ